MNLFVKKVMAAQESACGIRLSSVLVVLTVWLSSVAAPPTIKTTAPFVADTRESVTCSIIRDDGTLTALPLTLYKNQVAQNPTSVSMPILPGGARLIEVGYTFRVSLDDDGAIFLCTQETETGPLSSEPYTVKVYRPPKSITITAKYPTIGQTNLFYCTVEGAYGEHPIISWKVDEGPSVKSTHCVNSSDPNFPNKGFTDIGSLHLTIPSGTPSFVLSCKAFQNATKLYRTTQKRISTHIPTHIPTTDDVGTPVYTRCDDIWTTDEQNTITCAIPTNIFPTQCPNSNKTFAFFRNYKIVCSGTVPDTCSNPSDTEVCGCSPASNRTHKVLQYKVLNANETTAGTWFCHVFCLGSDQVSLLKFIPKYCGMRLRASITVTCPHQFVEGMFSDVTCNIVKSSLDRRCESSSPKWVVFSYQFFSFSATDLCRTSYSSCLNAGAPSAYCKGCRCGCTDSGASSGIQTYTMKYMPSHVLQGVRFFCTVQCTPVSTTVANATWDNTACQNVVIYPSHTSDVHLSCPGFWDVGPNTLTCSINMTNALSQRCVTYDHSMWIRLNFPNGVTSVLCTAPLDECDADGSQRCPCVARVADLQIYSYSLIGDKNIPTGSSASCHIPCLPTEDYQNPVRHDAWMCQNMDFFGTTSICPKRMVTGKRTFVSCLVNNHIFLPVCQYASPLTFSVQFLKDGVVTSKPMCSTSFPSCSSSGTATPTCPNCTCSCISPARTGKYFIYEMALTPDYTFQGKQLSCSVTCTLRFPWYADYPVVPANDSSCTDIAVVQQQPMAIRYSCPFPQMVIGRENIVNCSVNTTALLKENCRRSTYVLFELYVVPADRDPYTFPLCMTHLHHCNQGPGGQPCHCLNHTGEMRYYQMNFTGYHNMPLGSLRCRVPCLPEDVSPSIDTKTVFFCLFMGYELK